MALSGPWLPVQTPFDFSQSWHQNVAPLPTARPTLNHPHKRQIIDKASLTSVCGYVSGNKCRLAIKNERLYEGQLLTPVEQRTRSLAPADRTAGIKLCLTSSVVAQAITQLRRRRLFWTRAITILHALAVMTLQRGTAMKHVSRMT